MKFTKKDLKDWDVVVLRNGDRYVVNKAQGIRIKMVAALPPTVLL